MTTKPIPTHPSGVDLQGTKHHFSQAWRSIATGIISSLGFTRDGAKKDMGGCGATMLGDMIDETINHEFNLLEGLLSHYVHVC